MYDRPSPLTSEQIVELLPHKDEIVQEINDLEDQIKELTKKKGQLASDLETLSCVKKVINGVPIGCHTYETRYGQNNWTGAIIVSFYDCGSPRKSAEVYTNANNKTTYGVKGEVRLRHDHRGYSEYFGAGFKSFEDCVKVCEEWLVSDSVKLPDLDKRLEKLEKVKW